ncbi:YslB family protein [Peribacillus sp. SCS-155]|uniref:YslB family protein n=1 Tax=Peribacillus sedimenti TaxID=3115297 RepID=UPI003906A908
MDKNNINLLDDEQMNKQQIPAFGYEIIREFVLADILGKESPQILYWAGKQLARKFPLTGKDEIIAFFYNAGWGNLQFIKETRDDLELTLSGQPVERRFELNEDCHFQLEAGFLAEQFTLQRKFTAETLEEIKRRTKKVILTVKWDTKDPIG